MASLSVVISSFNEEKNIVDCLKSSAFADEIILVDNSSTDKTKEIAKKYTQKIFTRPNHQMLNINKNFGFLKASSEWILCLDADERITAELAKEIITTISNPKADGYKIPRKNIIFGKWIEHTGWYPDYQLRLFKRNKGRFAEKHVHEMLKVDGEVEVLNSPIEHQNYQTISQFIDKMNRIYTPNEAENLLKNGYSFNWLDSVRFPVREFLSRFFARKGYKDGLHGLVLSFLMAFYHLIIFVRLWEQMKFPQVDESSVINDLKTESKNLSKEFAHWTRQAKREVAKTPIEKILARFI